MTIVIGMCRWVEIGSSTAIMVIIIAMIGIRSRADHESCDESQRWYKKTFFYSSSIFFSQECTDVFLHMLGH